MSIPHPDTPLPSEITPETTYLNRRQFIQATLSTAVIANTLSTATWAKGIDPHSVGSLPTTQPLSPTSTSLLSTDEAPTPLEKVVNFSNFYEFGTDKTDPVNYAHSLKVDPWQINVVGAVAKPGVLGIEDILRLFPLEERIYRLRCVEGWSMVIPWLGISLAQFLKRFQPTSQAKFVQFLTLLDPQQMPGQRRPILNWPYQEGLRIDEAMHPLTLLSLGLYGRTLPKENGAPLRLVVPWKYGFKSIKSIVTIRLMEKQPLTSWEEVASSEYGFYANVNPEVPHPRWSQARERRIGEFAKRDTLLFNGYAEQVASLYHGMDLRKYY